MTKHSPDPAIRAAASLRAKARLRADPVRWAAYRARRKRYEKARSAKQTAERNARYATDPVYAATLREKGRLYYEKHRQLGGWSPTGRVVFRAVNIDGRWPRFKVKRRCTPRVAEKSDPLWARKLNLISSARQRARAQGVPTDLDARRINWPDRCPVLGIEFNWASQKDNPDVWSRPSVDRIRPGEGYTLDNVHIISFRANTVRGNATPAELRAVADYFEMFHG